MNIGNEVRRALYAHTMERDEIARKRFELRHVLFYEENAFFLVWFTAMVQKYRRENRKEWRVSKQMYDYMFKKIPDSWKFINRDYSAKGIEHLSFKDLILRPIVFKF